MHLRENFMSVANIESYDFEAYINTTKHNKNSRIFKWMNLNDTVSFSDVQSNLRDRNMLVNVLTS